MFSQAIAYYKDVQWGVCKLQDSDPITDHMVIFPCKGFLSYYKTSHGLAETISKSHLIRTYMYLGYMLRNPYNIITIIIIIIIIINQLL